MQKREEKFIEIDGFRIPRDNAEEYCRIRDKVTKETKIFFRTFCETIKKEPIPDLLGEGIVGYAENGEMLIRICLDPFALSAMKVAIERGKLKEYILAYNGYDEDDYRQLISEFEDRKQQKRGK